MVSHDYHWLSLLKLPFKGAYLKFHTDSTIGFNLPMRWAVLWRVCVDMLQPLPSILGRVGSNSKCWTTGILVGLDGTWQKCSKDHGTLTDTSSASLCRIFLSRATVPLWVLAAPLSEQASFIVIVSACKDWSCAQQPHQLPRNHPTNAIEQSNVVRPDMLGELAKHHEFPSGFTVPKCSKAPKADFAVLHLLNESRDLVHVWAVWASCSGMWFPWPTETRQDQLQAVLGQLQKAISPINSHSCNIHHEKPKNEWNSHPEA